MSMPTVEIGKKIVEDYINGPDSSFFDSNTLSIVDLREIPYTYSKLLRNNAAGRRSFGQ